MLTPKQQGFVAEYLLDLNATQAAIRAGYSKATAYSIGQENLNKPEIQSAISEAQARRQGRTEVGQDRVIKELAAIAFLDIRKLFDEGGDLKPVHALDEATARALRGIEVQVSCGDGGEVTRTHKVRAWDKVRALELLGRHLKLFTEKVEHSADDSLTALLARMNPSLGPP